MVLCITPNVSFILKRGSVLTRIPGRNQDVAVKRVIGEFTASQVDDFVSEADLMSKLRPHGKCLQIRNN
jgi:hypothetical protein